LPSYWFDEAKLLEKPKVHGASGCICDLLCEGDGNKFINSWAVISEDWSVWLICPFSLLLALNKYNIHIHQSKKMIAQTQNRNHCCPVKI